MATSITPQDIIELFSDIVTVSDGDCFLIFDADQTNVNYLTKVTFYDLQQKILGSSDYYNMLAKLKTATTTLDGDLSEAADLIENLKTAIQESQSATTSANNAATSANSAASDATAAAEEARKSIASVDEVVEKAEDALADAEKAKEEADEAREEVLETLAQYVPTGMELSYPSQIFSGNTGTQKIEVNLLPEGTLQNYIFQSDNNSVAVAPDGTLTVVGQGVTKIYVIPTNNTSLWQEITIEVIDTPMRLLSAGSIRLMGNGNIRLR